MNVDYNNFANTFATSRKNLKWEEIVYFFSFLQGNESILDIACGSGRLIEQYKSYFGKSPSSYLGIDLSQKLLRLAQITYPDAKFQEGKMQEVSKYMNNESYQQIFCIAGFHHLQTLDERIQTLKDWSSVLSFGGKIFMTNWALSSPKNFETYQESKIIATQNDFGSSDYSIKIGNYTRFYHDFTLLELEFLAQQSGFEICENRLFDSQKNTITILQKNKC